MPGDSQRCIRSQNSVSKIVPKVIYIAFKFEVSKSINLYLNVWLFVIKYFTIIGCMHV